MKNPLTVFTKENKKFDKHSFAKESFILSFVALGFVLILLAIIVDFISDIPLDSQTVFLMAVTCFGAYIYLMNLYYKKEERQELMKIRIILIYSVFIFILSVLLINNFFYFVFEIEIFEFFFFIEPVINIILPINLRVNPYGFLIYSLLVFYFSWYSMVMLVLFLFQDSRFWKEEPSNVIEEITDLEEEE